MEVHEPALAYGKQWLSPEEYLQLEAAAQERHEYYRGEVFTMAGSILRHDIVKVNLLTALKE